MSKENENSTYDKRGWVFVIAIIGCFIYLFSDILFSHFSENKHIEHNNISSEPEVTVTCNKNEAESFAEERVKSLGQVVLGSGFTTLRANDQSCTYVVQGLILPQQAREGKLVQMVVVKYSSGWSVDAVNSVN